MGTEILRPQDCLINKLRFSPPAFHRRRTSFQTGNNRKTANVYRTTTTTTEHQQQPDRKRKPIKEFQRKPAENVLISKRSPSADDLLQKPGQIVILRRGQSLESFEKKIENNKTQNSGSGRKVGLSIASDDIYAGSGCFVSPSPNSLPLPSFFFCNSNGKSDSDISATRDLRRLLGLN